MLGKALKFSCAAVVTAFMCFGVFLVVQPYRGQAASDYELREVSQPRTSWMLLWPKPDTLVHIVSPFGRFAVPFDSMGARGELVSGGFAGNTVRWSPAQDGYYHWSSFVVAFWMPDGAGVITEPTWLSNNFQIDPVDLKSRRAPLRPKEEGRSDPSRDRFVVVVGAFCPKNGSDLGSNWEGSHLLKQGFFDECFTSESLPVWPWHQMTSGGPGNTKIFCRSGYDICVGWIDLAEFGEMAQTYFPSDALDRVPAIAARLQAQLRVWRDSAGAQ